MIILNLFKGNSKDIGMFPFYTLWKYQKTVGFLMFSGGIEREHSDAFTVNFEQILRIVPVFLLFTLTELEKNGFINNLCFL